MKWFKHDSDAGQDAKLRKLKMTYGYEGYGLYFACLELICSDISETNFTFELEHDAEILAKDGNTSPEHIANMLTYMVKIGLFDTISRHKFGSDMMVIRCLTLLKRLDSSMTSSKILRKIIKLAKDQLNQEKVMTESCKIRIDKIRSDKNRIDNNMSTKADDLIKKSEEVFNYWVSVMQKRSTVKFSPERKTAVRKRLEDGYTVDDIKLAIDNCKRNKFNMGKNPNGRLHNDLELICRTSSKLDSFIETIQVENGVYDNMHTEDWTK